MRRLSITLYLLIFLALPAAAQSPATGFCIQNGSAESLLFVVNVAKIYRKLQLLAPQESLCTPEFDTSPGGFVSVFTSQQALEGCSRLTAPGSVQILLEYHDFDRCLWQTSP